MFKGLFKWISSRIKYLQMKRWMNQRASSTAVKLALSGTLRMRI